MTGSHGLMPGLGRRGFLSLLAGFALPAAAVEPASAFCEIFPRAGERRFQVLARDQVVGEHRFVFSHRDNAFVVRVDAAFALGPAAAPLYRYEHHSEEIWRDGWLQAVVSDTDRDGARWRLRMERLAPALGGAMSGQVNGRDMTVAGYLVPTSLWHHDTPASDVLFSVVDGFPKLITRRALGSRVVPFAGATLSAQGFRIGGQLRADVWYDSHCRLVRAAIPVFDGSDVILEAP